MVFFGELHDNALLHWLEIEYLKAYYKINKDITISMEMFERDTQSFVNEYLSDEISEEEFLQNSRAWGNYLTDYKPIIEFAKEKNLHVIAANVPRYIAALVNKNGLIVLDSLSAQEKKWVAKSVNTDDGHYKDKFYSLMGDNSPMMHGDFLDRLFAAQCVKDNTMAESIRDYLSDNSQQRIIHYNGDFHSQSHLGTVERLGTNIKSLVISTVIKNKGEKLIISPDVDLSIADYIIIINQN